MSSSGIIVIILIIANFLFSYKGFTNETFFDGYKFEVDKILVNKDYKRLITSGFLHVGWSHLILNMISLYIFSGLVEYSLGGAKFLIIYFASLIGGNLLSLLVHRHHPDYNAVGASGAVSGIIFASIALFPAMNVFFIPGWLYGFLYIGLSIYGIKSKTDNIGHEAHLGGALIGMMIAILMQPSALTENYFAILVITVPSIIFIYLIITKPQVLLIDNLFFKNHDHYDIDHKYNQQKRATQEEIDKILDKINKGGMKSLSKKEKEQLRQNARNI